MRARRRASFDAIVLHRSAELRTPRSYPTDAFERDPDQLLRLDGELHRQLLDDVLDEAVDDERDRLLLGEAALHAVELLVLGDLRRRRLVLELTAVAFLASM